MEIRDYTKHLSDRDRLYVFFIQNRGKILKFAVQYSAKINGRWRSVMRADNFHGTPHRHIFHLHSKELRVELSEDANLAFTQASLEIQGNFQAIKDNFLFSQ